MLLQIDECERQLLLEVLGSTLGTLRDVDTAGYETIRQNREAVMISVCERLGARASGLLVTGSDVRRAFA